MRIEELKDKHKYGVLLADKYSYLTEDQINFITNIHRGQSIEFAISVLEEVHFNTGYVYFINNKIQELKQQLEK